MARSLAGCAGRDLTPTMVEKVCPECGAVVEVFSTDTEVACDACGFVVYNQVVDCVQWCKHAKICVGDEMYRRLKAAAPSVD